LKLLLGSISGSKLPSLKLKRHKVTP
jgi:hypothetical protein